MDLEADYLVVGAGAMGMAFTDVLVTETDATVVIVDRNHRPGGHWNVAYPFVRLHQPSAWYGVNSKQLGSNKIDQVGFNKGLYELASGAEVIAYFDQVMREQFLPSGRVQYFPMCDYLGDNRFVSRVSGEEFQVSVNSKTVDSTYMNVQVPSMRPPPFPVAQGMCCVPLNNMVNIDAPEDGYVVIGAGKTGMDACLWLLQNGVSPDDIRWIMPRDSWILNRANLQPELLTEELAGPSEAASSQEIDSIDELFEDLERTGQLIRLDLTVKPTMYRCATVTMSELTALRQIKNVVRMGHVTEISNDKVILDEGTIPTGANVLHVDCTADALATRPAMPVFNGNHVTLQTVRTCQQVFSAAFIAHVEATVEDESEKNVLCTPVPHPDSDLDWLRTTLQASRNGARWSQNKELQNWLNHCRLDGFTRPPEDGEQPVIADKAGMMAAFKMLTKLDELLQGAEKS